MSDIIDYQVRVQADGKHVVWRLDGLLHREHGPATAFPDGTTKWFFQGKLHRTDGPAIERPDGTKEWWFQGKQHRTDGPAVEYANGTKRWYLQDKRMTKAEFEAAMAPDPCDGKTVEIEGKRYKLVAV